MLEELQAVVDRDKKSFPLKQELTRIKLQLQQLGAAAARSGRLRVGSGGAATNGVVVSRGLEARGIHGEILEGSWG